MSVAHPSMNIPNILGLTPHPVQVAEQARLAEIRRTDPGLASAMAAGPQTRRGIMPDRTREALRKVAQSLRKAGGIAEPEPPAQPSAPAPKGPLGPPSSADRRAERPPASAPGQAAHQQTLSTTAGPAAPRVP
jgi:penicillin-binding protein 1A